MLLHCASSGPHTEPSAQAGASLKRSRKAGAVSPSSSRENLVVLNERHASAAVIQTHWRTRRRRRRGVTNKSREAEGEAETGGPLAVKKPSPSRPFRPSPVALGALAIGLAASLSAEAAHGVEDVAGLLPEVRRCTHFHRRVRARSRG